MATSASSPTTSSRELPMPPANADFETTWKFLEEGVDHIMTGPQTGISSVKCMNLYTVCYNYCASSRMHRIHEPGRVYASANLMGSDLYDELTKYLVKHLKVIREGAENHVDEDLLSYYAKEWDRYTTGAKRINDRVFSTLNRNWVKRERDEGRKGTYPVYTLALVQWKQIVFTSVQNDKSAKLADAVLRLAEKQRDGETIDLTVVKKVVESFISLGLDEDDINKQTLDVYEDHFEKPFITATEKHYNTKSEALLVLLNETEETLKEEEGRISQYLDTATCKKLINKCGYAYSETIWKEFQDMFDLDKEDDLRSMHSLLSPIPGGLELLQKRFEEHVKRAALSAIERFTRDDEAVSEGSINPKEYFSALLLVRTQASETVERCFHSEVGFIASIDKVCHDLINPDTATGMSPNESQELLVMWVDSLLRDNKEASKEGDLESALNQVMVIFNYIENKEVFQIFYIDKLSDRLLHGASASEEAETSMISKLKETCGFDYTQKLQRMFTDMSLSKGLLDSFKEKMAVNHSEDTAYLQHPSAWSKFMASQAQKYWGRRLSWLWTYSNAELQTNYADQTYIFMTSALQMAVLVQYNDYDTITFDELMTNTGISVDLLQQTLAILTEASVLLNDDEGKAYSLNLNFKSKDVKVNLNRPIKATEIIDTKEALKNVDKDRKLTIQVIVVRVMKLHKRINRHALIQEVIPLVPPRFSPTIPDIEEAIDTLLDAEFIAPMGGVPNTFIYRA